MIIIWVQHHWNCFWNCLVGLSNQFDFHDVFIGLTHIRIKTDFTYDYCSSRKNSAAFSTVFTLHRNRRELGITHMPKQSFCLSLIVGSKSDEV